MLLACVLALWPHAVRADATHSAALEAYFAANQQLQQLIDERRALELTIVEASNAERAALVRFDEAEAKLAGLVRAHGDAARALANAGERLAGLDGLQPRLHEHTSRLERRVDAQEQWLFGGAQPIALSMRGYRAAFDALEQMASGVAAIGDEVAAVREEEAATVREVGRLNTEIVHAEHLADALSRQVGGYRARALRASAQLVAVQRAGLDLALELREQFRSLVAAGHPAGGAVVALGLVPVPEPLFWPTAPSATYSLPPGALAAVLRQAEPLELNASALPAFGLDPSNWTAPVKGPITTRYGAATPYQDAHWAVDIGTRLYEPVRAAADGIVEFAGLATGNNRLASYGTVVVLRHGDSITSLYAHLDDRAHGLPVSLGEYVTKGQVIGYVGLTGYTTGPHLHLEVRANNRPVDPLLLIRP